MHARINRRLKRAARECACTRCCGCRWLTCCFTCRCVCRRETLGKKEKAMFRAHSGECLAESQVDPGIVQSLLQGQLVDDPALRRHVYCVLVKCKVISKDGKLQKQALLAKLGSRADGKNATKILENCADQTGDTPEDLAWNLFRCGYERKAVLFEYMPLGGALDDNDAI